MADVWIVIPALDESENLRTVIPAVFHELAQLEQSSHVLVVDDGSRDGTGAAIADLAKSFGSLTTIRFRRNQGKATALRVGFRAALDDDAKIIVMMDADGQDNPIELPRLLDKVNAGTDLVTGARGRRQDRAVKRITSILYNRVTKIMSGAPGTDFNSGYKAMSAELARELLPNLYGEMHRYITVIAHWRGFTVDEIPVTHHPRLHGTSKYGIARFWRGFVDLQTIRFLLEYDQRPAHLFSALGFGSSFIGSGMLIYLLIDWLAGNPIGERPLLIAGALFFLSGLQLILFGLLAELAVHGRQRDRIWSEDLS